MTEDSTDELVKAILADRNLKRLLGNHWGTSIGTNGLKLWLIQHVRRKGRFFCCHFKGSLKGLTRERNRLKKEGCLYETEYLLDLIAFDEGQSRPGLGAEVEWSYSKVRVPGRRDRILEQLGIRSNMVEHQKDIEFYYDFSRILAVRPITGVFVGGSYYYEESIKRWHRGFEALLANNRPLDITEMSVVFLLNVPYRGEQKMAAYHWEPSQGNSLKSKGVHVLGL